MECQRLARRQGGMTLALRDLIKAHWREADLCLYTSIPEILTPQRRYEQPHCTDVRGGCVVYRRSARQNYPKVENRTGEQL